MEVTQALRARRSVRAFLPDAPPAATVQTILQEAAQAASGGNLQPWRVVALTGAPLQELLAVVAQAQPEEGPDNQSYPPGLWEPYRTRRFANGEDLYRSIGIPREDKAGRLQQLAKNAELFGAPVGIFVCVDERMGQPQWADLGIYLQSLMLLAVQHGLATCAQASGAAMPARCSSSWDCPSRTAWPLAWRWAMRMRRRPSIPCAPRALPGPSGARCAGSEPEEGPPGPFVG